MTAVPARSGPTLVEFVSARLDEIEADARAAFARSAISIRRGQPEFSGRWAQVVDDIVRPEDGMVVGPKFWPPAMPHVLRHDPARVLADCAVKRAIVEAYRASQGPTYEDSDVDFEAGRENGLEEAVRLLAAVDASHPDYNPAWTPS